MMENARSAICIPTYNRNEVIREFIENAAELYFRYGFDIYVYDSSENGLTQDVVTEKLSIYNKLHYVRIDPTVHSNMKVYGIFQEFGDSQKYEYLWVCSDSIRWSERTLKAVCTCMAQGYDLIVPNYRDVEKVGDREYTDRNRFFLDCAWHMTLYGAVILKRSTMLTDVDWDELTRKYGIPECINHSHVAFYFEKLSRFEGWKAFHLSLSAEDLHSSVLKKSPGWRDETFYVWCHCWPAMISKLPECYDSNGSKKAVIKKSGVNSTILSFHNLRVLRYRKILTIDVYRRYERDWGGLTNVPRGIIYLLACFPAEKVFYTSPRWLCRQAAIRINRQRHKLLLKRFCRRFDRLYIYGAGKIAARFTACLDAWGISFEGYLVSALSDNEQMAGGHKISTYSPELLQDERVGVIVALNEENMIQVMQGCLSGVDRNRIFSEYI